MKHLLFIALFCLASQLFAAETAVKIDAAQKGTEISPFIYGQFIEHLGRCINGGGIWAEMLEDRKFFYPVGDKESPWHVPALKDEKVLEMDTENPFAGKHTPKLILTKEKPELVLLQGNLEFRNKIKYTGYIRLKCSEGIESIDVRILIPSNFPAGNRTYNTQTIPVKIGGYYKHSFEFDNVSGGTSFEILLKGTGTVHIGCVSLMPSDNVQGLRADTLECLRQLDSPMYRWPGGNFVSGYDWKDGIGDRDKRPPRKNPAWKGVEPNDFGINEFMLFCKTLKTEPYIAVNTGDGDVDNALKELEYANGSIDTPMGKLRKEHGHPEPYNVVYWGIGNEMYGNWQIGHIPVEKYVEKHNSFVDVFRSKDSKIKVIGVGNVGKWDEAFLPGTAKHLDYISEHFYVQEKPELAEHIRQIPNNIRRIADAHRKYRQTLPNFKDVVVPIALDEWNYWYGNHVFGELGTRYYMKDALGVAEGLHEFARQSDMYFMANYAQTVNVIGCIKTSKTNAKLETTGLALELYRKHFGKIPVKTEVAADSPVDVQAAVDGDALTVGIVNVFKEDADVKLDIQNFNVIGKKLIKYEIADPQSDPNAFNDPDQPYRIVISEPQSGEFSGTVKVKPYSITVVIVK